MYNANFLGQQAQQMPFNQDQKIWNQMLMNQKGFNGQIKQPAQAPPQIYPNIPYVTGTGMANYDPGSSMQNSIQKQPLANAYESQYPLYRTQYPASSVLKSTQYIPCFPESLSRATKITLYVFLTFLILAVITIPLALIPLYINGGSDNILPFTIRVDDAFKITEPNVRNILATNVSEQKQADKDQLESFRQNLDLQLNKRLKANFGSEVTEISEITLKPLSDSGVSVSFNVSTLPVTRSRAIEIKNIINNAMNDENIAEKIRNPSFGQPKPVKGDFFITDPNPFVFANDQADPTVSTTTEKSQSTQTEAPVLKATTQEAQATTQSIEKSTIVSTTSSTTSTKISSTTKVSNQEQKTEESEQADEGKEGKDEREEKDERGDKDERVEKEEKDEKKENGRKEDNEEEDEEDEEPDEIPSRIEPRPNSPNNRPPNPNFNPNIPPNPNFNPNRPPNPIFNPNRPTNNLQPPPLPSRPNRPNQDFIQPPPPRAPSPDFFPPNRPNFNPFNNNNNPQGNIRPNFNNNPNLINDGLGIIEV